MTNNDSRNAKLVHAICTQCGGQIAVNSSQEKIVCDYCGTSFFVEKAINNYSGQNVKVEYVESLNSHKRGAVESVLNFVEKYQDKKQQKIDEEKRKQEEEKRKQEEKQNSNTWIFLFISIVIMIFGFTGLDRDKPNHEGEAKTPSGSNIQKGRDYQEVIADFKENGFKNIKTETLEDLIFGWFKKDGEVESVSVDGDEDYSSDVWFPNDVEVVITYHTFRKDDQSATETSTMGNTEAENKNEDANPEPVEHSTVEPTKEYIQEILTIENNEDMATLFKTSDFDPFISKFAEKYSGRIIQFDGYIANIMPHGDYKTRFDILIYTGNFGESSGNALSFKFEDINIVSDLKLTGSNIPENIVAGINLRITAEVEEYKEASGLFFLKPVSTEIR